jgi:hypothetical protein
MEDYMMHFDAEAGRFVYVMELNGRICPYYIHDTKLAHQYAAYNVIKKDLSCVKDAFMELDNNRGQSPIIRLSLLFSGVILYGKCFTEAKGRKTSLDYKKMLNSIGEQFSITHDMLMDVRNQHVAHAGEGNYEQYPVSLNLNPDMDNKQILGFMINGIQQVHHEPYLKDYLALVDSVMEYVSDLIERVDARLLEELTNMDIEAIYNSSKTPLRGHWAPITGIPKPKG